MKTDSDPPIPSMVRMAIKLAIAETDLEITKKFGSLRDEIRTLPPMIDLKIANCARRQASRRRWNFRALLAVAALAGSVLVFVVSNWPR